MGIDVAIEEQDGHKAKETIIALKTALMGSLAGVGDSLFHVIWGRFWFSCRNACSKWFGCWLCHLDYCQYCAFVWPGSSFTARISSKESN